MEIIFQFVSLIVVGGFIGGLTNYFAVKMLFRPLHPIYIGKWKLPFTPGLIPRRHKEIAEKLGQVVVEHLLTPEGLTEKLREQSFMNELNLIAKKEVARFLESDETIQSLAQSWHLERIDEETEQFLFNKLEERYWDAKKSMMEKQIAQILPSEFRDFADKHIPDLVDLFCTKAIVYFDSDEGKDQINYLFDRFLTEKGTLGNMVKMFLGNEMVVSKVQMEMIKFLRQPVTRQLLEKIIRNEWMNVQQKMLADFDKKINDAALLSWLKSQVRKHADLERLFAKPIGEILSEQKEWILEKFVPAFVVRVRDFALSKLETVLEKLGLEEVVRKQVESFPLERLEEIVLTISSREFKMITYLGVLLGGIIGFIQGLMFFIF